MSEYLFTPLPWSEEPLTLSDDSVAELSTLEITFVRFDEQSVRYEYRSSLKKALARLNAIATTRMNSSMPNLLAVLWLSAMQESEDSKGVSVSDCPFVTRSGDAALAIDAFNYMRRIDKIMAVPLSKPINQQWFFDTHAIFTSDKQGIQNDCYRTDPLWIDNSPISERACWGANPSDIPALMQDLVDFLSTPKMTPTVQAALAHFQLHAIQPFSVATDHVERSLSMTLVKKAGIADHIFPCFNLAAASHPDAYARALAICTTPMATWKLGLRAGCATALAK